VSIYTPVFSTRTPPEHSLKPPPWQEHLLKFSEPPAQQFWGAYAANSAAQKPCRHGTAFSPQPQS
jgi:hypothetical protein